MYLSFLLAPMALQGAVSDSTLMPSAAMHPKGASSYWEVQNIQDLPKLYENSPLWRILTDPDLATAVYGVSRGQVDLNEMLGMLVEEISLDKLPPEALAMGVDRLIVGLEGVSSSIILPEDLQEAIGELGPLFKTDMQLSEVGSAIGTQGFLSSDGLPASLDELEEVDPARLVDPFGNRLVYEVTEDSFTLTSLGRDGAAGGAGLDSDFVYEGDWGTTEGNLEDAVLGALIENVGIRLVLDFDSAETAGVLLNDIRLSAMDVQGESGTVDLGDGRSLDTFTVRESMGAETETVIEVWFARNEDHLVVGFGDQAPFEDFENETRGGFTGGLATDPGFLASVAGLPATHGDVLTGQYSAFPVTDMVFDVIEFGLSIAAPQLEQEMDEPLDLEQISSQIDVLRGFGRSLAPAGAVRVAMVDGHFESDGFTPAEMRTDTPSIGFEAIDPQVLAMLPPEAAMVFIAPVDYAGLSSQMESLLGGAVGELTAFEAALEMDLVEDLLAHLASQSIISIGRIRGIGLPTSLMHVQLRDAEAFQAGLARLLGGLVEMDPDRFKLKDRPYRGMPLWQFDVRLPELDMGQLAQMAPELGPAAGMLEGLAKQEVAFGVLGDILVVGPKSLHVKKELRRLGDLGSVNEDEPEPLHPLLSGELPLPAGVNRATYMDWGGQFASLYEMGKAFGGLAAGFSGEELPVDLSALPDADIVTRHLIPTLSTTVHGESGSLRHSRGSFGPEMQALPGLFSAGMQFYFLNSRSGSYYYGEAPVYLEPVDGSKPVDVVPLDVVPLPTEGTGSTREALQRVKVVLEVHRSLGGGSYPATLEQLVESTPDFPEGMFDGEPVPRDEWGNPFAYVPNTDGSSYRLYSFGPNGTDQGGEGDDLLVP